MVNEDIKQTMRTNNQIYILFLLVLNFIPPFGLVKLQKMFNLPNVLGMFSLHRHNVAIDTGHSTYCTTR